MSNEDRPDPMRPRYTWWQWIKDVAHLLFLGEEKPRG